MAERKEKISTDVLFENAISLYHEKQQTLQNDTFDEFKKLIQKEMKNGGKKTYSKHEVMKMFKTAVRIVLIKNNRVFEDGVQDEFEKALTNKKEGTLFSIKMINSILKETIYGKIIFSESEMFSLALDAITDEMKEYLLKGYKVVFNGLGSFAITIHKGHPVQFGASDKRVEDYPVCKFVSAPVLNDYIRSNYKK